MTQVLEGQARAYALLADLLGRGVRTENLDAARMSPRLAAAIDTHPDGDLDALAVDHQHVFGFSVALYEGVYLDETFSWGGRFAASCSDAYRRVGWVGDPRGEEPEHLATQLRVLSFLSGAEADALQDGRVDLAPRIRELARDFLEGHLLRWLPVFTSAVRRSDRAFPKALAEQVQELVLLHRAGLDLEPSSEPFTLPEPGLSLDASETGLTEIASYLCTPGRAGIYLSRDDLTEMGRGAEVPRGFGDRATTLGNLLRSASHLGQWDRVLSALIRLVTDWQRELDAEHGSSAPTLGRLLEPWRARAADTAAVLEQIRAAQPQA